MHWQRLQLQVYQLSDCIRSVGKLIFGSPHRFSNGFKSRLWVGHSRTFKDLFKSQSIILDVWFMVLCCWKVFFENLPVFGSVCMKVPTLRFCSVVAPGDSQEMSSTWFLPVEILGLQTREFNFCLIRSEKALFGKLQVGCHMPVYSVE